MALDGGDCPRAARALARHGAGLPPASPEADGRPCDLGHALAAAARLLAASRQPLVAGLGTDVAGARALYRLANACGAICDAAASDALMQGLRALQDRGQVTATLVEVRTRADLIVFVGGVPSDAAPLIGPRCGIGDPGAPRAGAGPVQSATVSSKRAEPSPVWSGRRHVVVLGPNDGDAALLASWAALPGVTVEIVRPARDLFDTLALLNAATARRITGNGLQGLVQRLRTARYAVLIGAPALLPAPASLLIEAVHRLVGELNRHTRAAALWIGGGNGAATVNQVFAWLSGLPLRSRIGPRGIEHDPVRFDSARLIADRAVDALLWVSSFDDEAAPPPFAGPLIVLGPPALAASCRRPGGVFVPVATPGIGCDGHLFRTDGTVLMPLHAVREDPSPTVADVAAALLRELQGAPARASTERAATVP